MAIYYTGVNGLSRFNFCYSFVSDIISVPSFLTVGNTMNDWKYFSSAQLISLLLASYNLSYASKTINITEIESS